jgi:hypothetical protein
MGVARLGYPAAGWVLAAAYLQYVWTQLGWVPRHQRTALNLDLFAQPGEGQVYSLLLNKQCGTPSGRLGAEGQDSGSIATLAASISATA